LLAFLQLVCGRILGRKTSFDFSKPLKKLVDEEIAQREADEEGFFIEK